MTDHTELRKLFVQACDLSPQLQQQLIDRCCADDPHLRSQLKQLLHQDAATDGILADTSLTDGIELHLEVIDDVPTPARIGKYRIKKRIGEGGMGIVYLAQQAQPERDVALKVIRPGVMSRELLRRFEFEVTVLAKLQHPGIAQIYEAGFDETGQPFFAMEFIEGVLLGEHLIRNGRDPTEIIDLFLKICSAVNHAHVRGVIHRDLKPANIMVRHDGQPVVLDFGVARATNTDVKSATQHSKSGQLVGTLPYMSPERICGNKDFADTRSDVYSLGVILYELLSGSLPYEIQGKVLINAARTIEESSPRNLAVHDHQFRGDLNTIVMKALETDPDQRYASATALADDLQRFQNHQPVLAHPPSQLYKIRKFAHRNRTLVLGITACLAILIVGIIGTTLGMFRAQHETNRLTAVNEFISRILVSPDPAIGNANVKFARVLKDAANEAPVRFADYPELEADVSLLIGRGFVRLAMIEDAIPLLSRSYDLRSQVLGPRNKSTREAGLELVSAMLTRDARGVIQLASQLLDQLPEHQHTDDFALRLRSNIAFAHSRLGNRKLAEEQLREILNVAPATTQREIDFVRETRVALASTLRLKVTRNESEEPETDRSEAIDLYRAAIDQAIHAYGEDHSTTLFTMLNLVDCLEDGSELNEAEQLAMRVIELAPHRHSPEHELSIRPLKDMTFIRYQQERYQQAADFQIKAVDLIRQRDGDRGVSLIVMMADALPVIEAAGRFKVGEEYSRFLLDELSGGHYEKLAIEHKLFLARFLSGQGMREEAEQCFTQVADAGDIETNSNLKCLYSLFMGEHKLAGGDREQAQRMFQIALDLCLTARTNSSPRPRRIRDALARTK